MEIIECKLKREREKLGMSQKQLAAIVGISEKSIYNFEKGRVPSLPTAIRLANYMDLTVEQLFTVPPTAHD